MPKVASPISKPESTEKKAVASAKPRRRAATRPAPSRALPQDPSSDASELLIKRLGDLEEKVSAGFAALTAEMQALRGQTVSKSPDDDTPSETFLPIVADLIRRSLMEHITPVTAALKRLEERIGFVSNRLKNQGGGDRQKPWRHDHQRHPRHRAPNGPRPGQGQPWSPPSAASVQGHFAPRPFGREEHAASEEEE